MIHLDCVQGSPEWHEARLGLPTASNFHRLLQPKKLGPSTAAKKYLHELVAETLLGAPVDDVSESAWMTRGKEMEAEARAWYEFEKDVDTAPVGFCLTDDRSIGASPDAFVGDDGLLEIKCPNIVTHVGYMLDGMSHEHRCQVQGQLLVTGRAWCDLLIYSPALPPLLVRHEPDAIWTVAFKAVLSGFVEQLAEAREKVNGLAPPRRREPAGIMNCPSCGGFLLDCDCVVS